MPLVLSFYTSIISFLTTDCNYNNILLTLPLPSGMSVGAGSTPTNAAVISTLPEALGLSSVLAHCC